VSSVASARVPSRKADPGAIRRTMRVLAMTRAAARFMAGDRALELARNLGGIDDDLLDVATIKASIDRRRAHFGLELTGSGDYDAGAAAEAIFNAFRSA
jgi:hypothetical protein